MTRGMRWGPPFYRKNVQKHWHIINIVYIMFIYVYIKYVHLIMLYLLCFFVIVSDFPKLCCATGSKDFKDVSKISCFNMFQGRSRIFRKLLKNGIPRHCKPNKMFRKFYNNSVHHFLEEKKGEKMKLSTFQANHLVFHFIDMPLFVGPSGFHSIEIGFHSLENCYDMQVWHRHSLELGAPFFRCSASSPPPVH